MRRLVAALLACLLAAGCATTTKYREQLATWQGRSESELVSQWGPPDKVYVTDAGEKVVSYVNQRTAILPGSTPFYHTATVGNRVIVHPYGGRPPEIITRGCQTDFTLIGGKVSAWRAEGNNCLA